MPLEIPVRPGQIAPDVGPPLLGFAEDELAELPFTSYGGNVPRWAPVHDWREYGAGKKEPVFNGVVTRAYRARFTLDWQQLEDWITPSILEALFTCSELWFAPYSDGDGAASPQAFEVNVLGEIADAQDLLTRRRPLSIELESVYVFTVCEGVGVPVRPPVQPIPEDPGGCLPPPETVAVERVDGGYSVTWDAVADAGAYLIEHSAVAGGDPAGTYSRQWAHLLDLADPDAPSTFIETGATNLCARVYAIRLCDATAEVCSAPPGDTAPIITQGAGMEIVQGATPPEVVTVGMNITEAS